MLVDGTKDDNADQGLLLMYNFMFMWYKTPDTMDLSGRNLAMLGLVGNANS